MLKGKENEKVTLAYEHLAFGFMNNLKYNALDINITLKTDQG